MGGRGGDILTSGVRASSSSSKKQPRFFQNLNMMEMIMARKKRKEIVMKYVFKKNSKS